MSKENPVAEENLDAELEKSAAELVDKAFADENEEIVKAGQGGDKNSEKMDGIKGDGDATKDRPTEATGGKDVLKAKKGNKAFGKEEDDDKMDDEGEGEDDGDDEKMKKMKKMCKTQKSFEVSESDYEVLVKAKAALAEQEEANEQESFKKSVTEIVDERLGDIKYQLDGIVKALSKPVERKSIDKVEAVEKSFAANEKVDGEGEDISKAQILDKMEELAKSGDISINSVVEYETCGTVSSRHDFEAVKKSFS